MTTEKESGEETVYEESGGEKAPYVSKEILPEIEGVLVVAEGGDSPRIVSDISDAVKALFQVEAHRIKVVKMSSKEDGTTQTPLRRSDSASRSSSSQAGMPFEAIRFALASKS